MRSSGKTTLAQTAAIIGTGHKTLPLTWSYSDEEQRKALTGWSMSGGRVALFDNLRNGTPWGGENLAKLATDANWSDRILGGNKLWKAPWTSATVFTGNNVSLAEPDMARRLVYTRLEPNHECPELRPESSFRHPDLESWVREHQAELLAAVLTILRAYAVAGRPPVKLAPMSTYSDSSPWSRHVRAPLVWAGYADPAHATDDLRAHADPETRAARQVVTGLQKLASQCIGSATWNTSTAFKRLYQRSISTNEYSLDEPWANELRDAIEAVRGPRAHGPITSPWLGRILSTLRNRVVGGNQLTGKTDPVTHAEVWEIVRSDID